MTFRALRRRRSLLIALPLATVFIGAALTGSTLAAFSDSGTSSGSAYSAGTIVLANNDTASSTLSFTGLQPGSTGSKCFLVTSTGTLASAVKLYIGAVTSTNGLSSALNVSITQGTGTAQSCSDFTALSSGSALASGTLASIANASSFTTGVGTWAPTGTATETRAFQVTWSVAGLAPAATQNSAVTVKLTWEARTA